MGLLDRLDDRVLGPKDQPPDPRRMRAGHWFGVAVVLAIVIASLISSGGGNNPAIWPLAGMATGSLIFAGRRVASQRASTPPYREQPSDDATARTAADGDIQRLAGGIVDAEKRRE